MIKTTFQFEFKDLKLEASQIGKDLGYKVGEESGIVNDLIKEVLNECMDVKNFRAEYKIYEGVGFISSDKSVNINNINFQLEKVVYGQIKKSDSIAVFLCTAGAEIGIRSRKISQEGDPLKGYIYDVVGSEIVEAVSDLMQSELEKTVIASGKKITNRYNPGYCGWDVAEQHKLFQLVPGNFCGISLTLSALMDPVKSASGFIGIGENVKYNPYTCSLCDLKDCNYRKIREKV
jgi:hypothetical protein